MLMYMLMYIYNLNYFIYYYNTVVNKLKLKLCAKFTFTKERVSSKFTFTKESLVLSASDGIMGLYYNQVYI